MNKEKLNQRQLIFCNQIFLGKSITDAAIFAGYSPKTGYVIGSKLLKKPQISSELARRNAAVQAKIEFNQIMSKEERMKRLSDIAKADFKAPIGARDTTSAISELNKMDGSYAPEKHAVLGDIQIEVIYTDRRKDAIQRPRETEGVLEGQKEGEKDVHP